MYVLGCLLNGERERGSGCILLESYICPKVDSKLFSLSPSSINIFKKSKYVLKNLDYFTSHNMVFCDHFG